MAKPGMVATKVDVDGRIWVSTRDIEGLFFGQHIPEQERYRRYFGRNINPGVIEEVLLSATFGHMRDLTDLGYETLRLDPHLASAVGKRVRAVGSIQPKVTPASGEGIDPKKANRYADMVRRQLFSVPRLRQRIINLSWAAYFARAALEIDWRETRNLDERWVMRDLHWIHPRRLSLGPDRELRVRDDLFYGSGFEKKGFDLRELPFKFVTSRRQLFNDYLEREGLVQPCLYFSYFKRFSWRERLTLTELYGKPWKWVEATDESTADDDDLDYAKRTADEMGANNTGVMPAGLSLKMQSVGPNAGQIHKEIHTDCNDEISKLVLGSTSTTDAKTDGLGGGLARVHQDSETLVFTTDCDEVAEDLTQGLARAIVLLNGGPEDADLYTPRIELPYELPPDPSDEIERVKNVLSIPKLRISEAEVYQRIGFAKPEPDEPYFEGADPAAIDPFGALTTGGTGGSASGAQEFSVTPSDTSDQNRELQRLSASAFRAGRVRMSGGAQKQVIIGGLAVHIDRPKGFVQTGVDLEGNEWSRTYELDYGFLPRTQGGDDEALDVFVGPNLAAETVWWVKQRKADGSFDEYKLFIGFDHAQDVVDAYRAHIPMEFFAAMSSTSLEQVKALLGLHPTERLSASPAYAQALAEQRVRNIIALMSQIGPAGS